MKRFAWLCIAACSSTGPRDPQKALASDDAHSLLRLRDRLIGALVWKRFVLVPDDKCKQAWLD